MFLLSLKVHKKLYACLWGPVDSGFLNERNNKVHYFRQRHIAKAQPFLTVFGMPNTMTMGVKLCI